MSFLEPIIGVVNGHISVGIEGNENDKFCDRKSVLPKCQLPDQRLVWVVPITTATPTALKSQRVHHSFAPSTLMAGKQETPAPIGEKIRTSREMLFPFLLTSAVRSACELE